ncbi:MAG: DNA polymerase III subunit gamma/tau [Anaerolineae bacterium]|nr:DNA polymerase III subunit gamma/tau [Anaerolineae bacterium]
MSLSLSRKWRPARFADVVGQEHVTQTLQNALIGNRIGHAYLFCGPRGTGKTTTARLLAKAVNCLHEDVAQRPDNTCHICLSISEGRFLDLIEIDAASNTGVDDIRDLREKVNFSPSEGQYKVYIIDEVHMLSTAAFNALLKTLEEPPPHVIFVLATTEEHKVPITIKSRCQQFNFRLLSIPEIIGRLQFLTTEEQITIEPDALSLIAREGAGSIRDAESLLDQLVTAPGATITLNRAQQVLGTASSLAVRTLTNAWLDNDTAAGLKLIHDALASGTDARQFCRQMVTYLRQLLLLHTAGQQLGFAVAADQLAAMQVQAQRADRKRLIDAIKQFNQAATQPTSNWQPQLPLELAFIELVAGAAMLPLQPSPPPQAVATEQKTSKPSPAPTAAVVESRRETPPEIAFEPLSAESTPETHESEEAELPAGPLTMASILSVWPDVIQEVRKRDRNIPAFLAQCQPLAIEGDTVILGFEYPILRDKFESNPRATTIVGEVLSQLINRKCLVRSVNNAQYSPRDISKADFEALAQELGGVVRDNG